MAAALVPPAIRFWELNIELGLIQIRRLLNNHPGHNTRDDRFHFTRILEKTWYLNYQLVTVTEPDMPLPPALPCKAQ
jgi:hypothetical protein